MPFLQFLAAGADLTSALGWSYEPRLVALSFVVATLAAYAALGLAISRRLIEAIGGTLTVESEVRHGSTFTATLPLVEEDETTLEPPEEERHPEIESLAPGQEVAVLVADDRQSNRDILVCLLQGAGSTTDEAENGREALEKLRAGRFSLVLMDIRILPALRRAGRRLAEPVPARRPSRRPLRR